MKVCVCEKIVSVPVYFPMKISKGRIGILKGEGSHAMLENMRNVKKSVSHATNGRRFRNVLIQNPARRAEHHLFVFERLS